MQVWSIAGPSLFYMPLVQVFDEPVVPGTLLYRRRSMVTCRGRSIMVRSLLLLSPLSSSHASLAARTVGLYVPCITVRCDRGLEDISLWPSSGVLGLVACVLATSATIFVCGQRCSSAIWRKLSVVASALLAMVGLGLPVLLFVHLQRARTTWPLWQQHHTSTQPSVRTCIRAGTAA